MITSGFAIKTSLLMSLMGQHLQKTSCFIPPTSCQLSDGRFNARLILLLRMPTHHGKYTPKQMLLFSHNITLDRLHQMPRHAVRTFRLRLKDIGSDELMPSYLHLYMLLSLYRMRRLSVLRSATSWKIQFPTLLTYPLFLVQRVLGLAPTEDLVKRKREGLIGIERRDHQ